MMLMRSVISHVIFMCLIYRVKNELGVDVWIGLSQAIERLKIGVQKY